MPSLQVRLSALLVRKTVLSNSKYKGYVLGLNETKGDARMVATGRHKWLALALLSVVQFMLVLDIAIVNVALPSIQLDLGFSQENLQWVISAYALVFGGFLLLGGRAADLLGRRRLFMSGLVVFTYA